MGAVKEKWTPGPWTALLNGEGPHAVRSAARPLRESVVVGCIRGLANAADARLIAAAPDMYEALREAVEDYGARMPAGWMNEARAALAKARGEETTR